MMRLDSINGFTTADELAYYGMAELREEDNYVAMRQLTDMRYLDLSEALDSKGQIYRVHFSNGTIRHWSIAMIRSTLQRKPIYIIGIEPSTLESKGETLAEHMEGESRPYCN